MKKQCSYRPVKEMGKVSKLRFTMFVTEPLLLEISGFQTSDIVDCHHLQVHGITYLWAVVQAGIPCAHFGQAIFQQPSSLTHPYIWTSG